MGVLFWLSVWRARLLTWLLTPRSKGPPTPEERIIVRWYDPQHERWHIEYRDPTEKRP